jgi:hypothetical protein
VVHQLVLDLLSHDQDDAVETGGDRVAAGEVHEGLAVLPDWSKLFQSPETATVTGCEQYELHG